MDITKILNKGLRSGFAGNTQFMKTKRANFELNSSHCENTDGGIYHDEWIGGRLAGGQEIVQLDKELYTRVYAGGSVGKGTLGSLKITEEQIIKYLKSIILQYSSQIRLDSDFTSQEGEWKYSYKVIETIPIIDLVLGKEIISYQDKAVFVHVFIISPIVN